MADYETGKRPLSLSPGKYAMLKDADSGKIQLIVGPKNHSMTNSEIPVRFERRRGFVKCELDDAILNEVFAPEGHYIVLFNPSKDGTIPRAGSKPETDIELDIGRKVMIPGPMAFALWPGQMADVVRGHTLRSNEYLLIKIYNEEEARKNWLSAVVREAKTGDDDTTPALSSQLLQNIPVDLSVGKRYVVKGTEASFYMPPTGVSVEADNEGELVRSALTLEQLHSCILLGEGGDKRVEWGPAVVFPEPTERFLVDGKDNPIFNAVTLNDRSGIHVQVVSDYKDGKTAVERKQGEELWITGKDTQIYFPRPEHRVIRYDNQAKHFADNVTEGTGRYVQNIKDSVVKVVDGPRMLLCDPRWEIVVRRPLSSVQCELMYPGNYEAAKHNELLRGLSEKSPTTRSGAVSEGEFTRSRRSGKRQGIVEDTAGVMNYASVDSVRANSSYTASSGGMMEQATLGQASVPDALGVDVQLAGTFSQNRTMVLGDKYKGVPVIKPWPGFAVMKIDMAGNKEVVEGPATIKLKWTEELRALNLSTDTPKSAIDLLRTGYLQTKGNRVSDHVFVVSSDHVEVRFSLSFRVDFEGDTPEEKAKWFDTEDYIGLLTDHVRSVLMGVCKHTSGVDLYANGVDIVRNTILGIATDDKGRPGMFFEDNNMRIVDVEVLNVRIVDSAIREQLDGAQREAFAGQMKLERSQRNLDITMQQEAITRQMAAEKHVTEKHALSIEAEVIDVAQGLELKRIECQVQKHVDGLKIVEAENEKTAFRHNQQLSRDKSSADLALEARRLTQVLELEALEGRKDFEVARMNAAVPELTAALTALSNNETLTKVAEAMLIYERRTGVNAQELFEHILPGADIATAIKKKFAGTNGHTVKAPTSQVPPTSPHAS